MKQTVLIADSDAELCDLYRWFFTQHGYEVETSIDGLDCLGKLLRLEPDALVLDHKLHWGRCDGVFAWLGKEILVPEIPVILLDAAECPQRFADCIGLPVVDYLLKPFRLIDLLEKVRSAVAKRGQRAPSYRNNVNAELFIG